MRLLQPLAVRPVALLWGGLSLSAVGDQLYGVALVWVAVEAFGPAAGYLTSLQAGCGLVAAAMAGRWADRWDQRRAMAAADLVRAAVLLALAGWWLARGTAPAAGLAAAILVLAVGNAVFQPAMSAVLPSLLPRDRLPAANALFDTTDRSARLLGPGLVGVLAGILPVVHFFTLDAATFLVSAAVILCMPALPVRVPVTASRSSLLGSLRLGFAAMWGHRILGTCLWLSGVANGFWTPAMFLALPLAIGDAGITGPGGTGLSAFGLVVSAYGASNLAGTLVVGSRPVAAHPARTMFAGTLLVGVAFVGMGLAAGSGSGLWGLMALAAVAGFGGPVKDIPTAVLRQTELPPGSIPASTRASMVANAGGTLLAMLLAPTASRLLGGAGLLTLCGLAIACAAGWAMVLHRHEGRHAAA